MACPSRVNAANADVDDKETRRSTHMHVRSYVARPWKVRCKNYMQLYHSFGERVATIQVSVLIADL
ncbi:hypothetical protein J1N35_024823 [Gossypium stocksii]|uniref:Uncharacterized protein n=1 Tax=Gossypium stocksii TaxID=47602 RepID=A0A9D3ZVM8_9ROSI|nr:hypothetical protein J1N35_024823 [Gossypium stocksii]